MGSYKTRSRTSSEKFEVKQTWPNGFVNVQTGKKLSDQTTYSYSSVGEQSDEDLKRDFLTTRKPRRLTDGSKFANELRIDPKTHKPERTTFDNGHHFSTIKRWESHSHRHWKMKSSGYLFEGPLTLIGPVSGGYTFPVVADMSQNDVNFYGAKAIAATTPTAPVADLSTFVGETALSGLPVRASSVLKSTIRAGRNKQGKLVIDALQDSVPQLQQLLNSVLARKPTSAALIAGSMLGGAYISTEFAWKPFIADIEKLAHSILHHGELIRQFVRDGGPDKMVRRRYSFPQTHVMEPAVQVGTLPAYLTDLTANSQYVWIKDGKASGPVFRQDQVFTDIWFSGAYTYFVDEVNNPSFLDKMTDFEKKANFLLGSRLSPQALWEMAPWSWLIDYKLNVGDVIANVSNFDQDNLVLRYGYLMRKTHAIRTYSVSGIEFKSGSPGTVYRRFDTQRKERYKATPYGFGLDPAAFSDKKWANIIAIGMSRGDNRFLRNE